MVRRASVDDHLPRGHLQPHLRVDCISHVRFTRHRPPRFGFRFGEHPRRYLVRRERDADRFIVQRLRERARGTQVT